MTRRAQPHASRQTTRRAPEPTSAPRVQTVARRLVGWLTGVVGTVFGSLIFMLVGQQPLPHAVPLFDVVRIHPILAVVVGTLLLAVTVTALILAYIGPSGPPKDRARRGRPSPTAPVWHLPFLAITTGVSALSTSAVIALVALILLRPSWCPVAFCPQPPGPHDDNLEAAFTALESSTFLIPGDPTQYSLSNLPDTRSAAAVVAQATVGPGQPPNHPPYRLVLRMHSLQRGGPGMFIEQIRLPIHEVGDVPDPLRVWLTTAPLDYQANPYTATYAIEDHASTLWAHYAGSLPEAHVQLRPGEADEVTVAVAAQAPAKLRFGVEIVYRVANEVQTRTLALPYVFQAVFADPRTWQAYELKDGHFVPG
jgi:hypothetical protein